MKRPKKKSPPEKVTLAPGIEHITYGKGFTRQTYILAKPPIASRDDIEKYEIRMQMGTGFEPEITAEIEREAKKILEKAGLPTDTGLTCSAPAGEFHVCLIPLSLQDYLGWFSKSGARLVKGLVQLVEDRGYREREDPEWYAAMILFNLSGMRWHIKHGANNTALMGAYSLGILVTEAKGLGYFREMGATGGKKKRLKSPFNLLIRFLLRKDKKETAPELWKAIPEDEEIKIENYKFYRDDNRLRALVNMDGRWIEIEQSLGYNAFRKRVTRARKPPSR